VESSGHLNNNSPPFKQLKIKIKITKVERWTVKVLFFFFVRFKTKLLLFQAMRNRIASQEACTKMIVPDDLKAMGINTRHFTRWLQKLTDDGLVIQNGDHLTLDSHHKSV